MRISFGRCVEASFLIATIISASITIMIFGFMLFLGFPLFQEGMFFNILNSSWLPAEGIYGIFPMMVGTLAIGSLAVIIAFPISLGCSIYINVLASSQWQKILKRIVQFMTGMPTVVYGFVGVFLLVPIIREMFVAGSGMSILAASLVLAVVISPTMILIFCESYNQVPRSIILAVEGLGGSPVQKFLYVILPYSKFGIVNGLVLALGRAMGDTLIALMIAGNAIATPQSVLDSARTLTAHIALLIAADFESMEFKTLFACGIVLYVFTTVIVLAVRFFSSRVGRVA